MKGDRIRKQDGLFQPAEDFVAWIYGLRLRFRLYLRFFNVARFQVTALGQRARHVQYCSHRLLTSQLRPAFGMVLLEVHAEPAPSIVNPLVEPSTHILHAEPQRVLRHPRHRQSAFSNMQNTMTGDVGSFVEARANS